VVRVRRNGLLFAETEPCRAFYLQLSGRLKLAKHSPDGREQTLRVVDPGESFGEADALTGTHLAAGIALRSSRVLALPADFLRQALERGGPVAQALAATLAADAVRLGNLAAELSLLNVTARVARLLLTREDCLVGASGGLSQQEMASLAGTARQVVGRILRRLEEEGIIDLERGRIQVLDPARLAALAHWHGPAPAGAGWAGGRGGGGCGRSPPARCPGGRAWPTPGGRGPRGRRPAARPR